MDPNATLRDLLDSLKARDWDRVQELSESLLGWIEKRGFPPVTIGPAELGNEWHRAFATFVCHAALGKVRTARGGRNRKQES